MWKKSKKDETNLKNALYLYMLMHLEPHLEDMARLQKL